MEPTPTEAEPISIESLPTVEQALGTRKERRSTERAVRRERSRIVRMQQLDDSKIVVEKKAKLKRRFGNPTKRQEALIEWFVAENHKRGYE